MNLLEFEGKQIMRKYQIPVPESHLITTKNAQTPLPYPFVLKAQVMTGGRGKAGGVKICKNEADYRKYAEEILQMKIKGHPVYGLLAEQMVETERELYLSITLQGVARPTLIASSMGGMDIEQVSKENPDNIIKIEIDPLTRLKLYQKKYLAEKLGIEDKQNFIETLSRIEKAFLETGAELLEINPLGVVNEKLIAMDSKLVLDNNVSDMRELMAQIEADRKILHCYQTPEREATTITYVPLHGNVGLISDGAGTGMLTLDLLNDEDLDVASFCELGGMTSDEVMYRAMDLTLTDHSEIEGVLIVLIGGFNRMDNMAMGITKYVNEHQVKIPIYTRMCGTMEEAGLNTMQKAGMKTYSTLTETVKELTATVKEG